MINDSSEIILFQKIKKLILIFNQKIDDELSNGTLRYNNKYRLKSKIINFKYDENGHHTYTTIPQNILKREFNRNDISRIKESFFKTKEYINLLNFLTDLYESFDNQAHLNMLIYKFTLKKEDVQYLTPPDIDQIIKTFIKESNNESIKFNVCVHLVGVNLESEKFKLSSEVILRRPKAEDFEFVIINPFFNTTNLSSKPSTILESEILCRNSGEVQKYIKKAIALLKLFKIASVTEIRYDIKSDSIFNLIGTFESRSKISNESNYLILKDDENKVIEFWNRFFDILPEGMYWGIRNDYLTIAFSRYSDSLFDNIGSGNLIKRTALIVMGLEALFFKSQERNELTYKLSKRISKIMSFLGHDSIKISKTIKEAYDIRSTFVHGGHLDSEEVIKKEKRLKKLNIMEDHENLGDFTKNITELLRILINLTIPLRNGEKDDKDKLKEKFIDRIDNSLIDKNEESKLQKLIIHYKEVLI